LGLYDELKGRADRIRKTGQELQKLWEKLSFPLLSKQQVSEKADKLIIVFEKNIEQGGMKNLKKSHYLFDITNLSGNWLCSEDKELYRKQIELGGVWIHS